METPMNIDDLRPAPYNPRKINEAAARGLQKSLGDFGDLSGIVWNSRTGNLVCGHQRVSELRKLGAQLINGALQISSGERFMVRLVDWPIAQEMAANVVANNTAIGGEFTSNISSILDEVKAGMGENNFAELMLGNIEIPEIEDIDLGDGMVADKAATETIQIMIPAGTKKKMIASIRPLVEQSGGVIIE
jgi:hypothetical protein